MIKESLYFYLHDSMINEKGGYGGSKSKFNLLSPITFMLGYNNIKNNVQKLYHATIDYYMNEIEFENLKNTEKWDNMDKYQRGIYSNKYDKKGKIIQEKIKNIKDKLDDIAKTNTLEKIKNNLVNKAELQALEYIEKNIDKDIFSESKIKELEDKIKVRKSRIEKTDGEVENIMKDKQNELINNYKKMGFKEVDKVPEGDYDIKFVKKNGKEVILCKEKENKDKTEKLSDKEKNLIKKYDGDIEKLNKELNGYKNKKNLSDDDIKKIDDLKNEINNLTDKKYVILEKY